jgi:site-specific recombinase XerC
MAHWLRHSAGSHVTDSQVDLRYVRDDLGHASITTGQRRTRTTMIATEPPNPGSN